MRDVINGHAHLNEVRELLERDPVLFQVLRSLIAGNIKELTDQQVIELEDWIVMERDRRPHPDVVAIIEAGYRETPDGPCIVNPFVVKSPADAAIIEQAEQHHTELERQSKERLSEWAKDPKNQDSFFRFIFGRDEDEGKDVDKGKDRQR